ncbi:hypothetical protein HYC85_031809 [Camellia sinensis]|uniref:DDT domain-containing protein n=1 Tax=Camellia sinensis TaxID=4442 RepID=A0A7J7FV79_CAMSI|nr:hypothetical protein HYC85_031809 [Camellia sinensis]
MGASNLINMEQSSMDFTQTSQAQTLANLRNTESCKSDDRREEEKRGFERETGSAAQDFNLERCAPSGSETGSVTTTIDGSKGKGFVLEEPSKGTNGKEHSHREMQGKENSASGEHRVHRGGEHRMHSLENIWHDENETGNGGSNLDNTKCKLLNWHGTTMVVVEGTIASTDFKQLVHHVPLGPGCWKVWVKHVKVNALLFRPNHEMFVLEDAIVWRFLKNFADVLVLWPFMLDEFVQAFHDYDPRLLGEIHVALLSKDTLFDWAGSKSKYCCQSWILNKHICNEAATLDQEDTVIDESNSGEPWVQGLMEGEYSDLSVEERLSAVVALIGVANEGNSIRIILEERLEAANALKKQMWAEVQLDKRQMKEEYVMKMQYPSYISDNAEPNVQISSVEGRQGPLPTVDDKNGLVSTNLVEQKEHLHDAQNDPNYPIHMPSERNPQIQELSTCTDNLSLLQPGYAAERSRLQLKAYIGHKVEEMYVYWSLPLGQDHRQNRY